MPTQNSTILPLKPTKNDLEQLLRVQYFLAHSLSHAKKNTSVDRMIAIHGLGNVNEYILKFIVDVLEIESKVGSNFKDSEIKSILGQVSKFLKNEFDVFLPHSHDIKSLRQIRNLVQHNGLDPNISDLSKYCQAVENFFFKILKILFDLEKEDLRLSSVVQNIEIRSYIAKAEIHLDKKDYLQAVIACRDAFENAHFKRIEKTSLYLSAAPAQIEASNSEYIKYFYQNITDDLFIHSSDINLSSYRKFQDYIHYIPLEYSHSSSAGVLNRPWEKQDAEYCYHFAVNTILQWELEELPEIHNPSDPDFAVDDIKWEEYLNNTELAENGCIYSGSKDSEFRLFYIDKNSYDRLDLSNWKPKDIETFTSIQKNKGKIKKRTTYKIKIKGFHFNLITNTPPRWSFIFHYDYVPFGRVVEEEVNGKIEVTTKSLNKATIEELANSLKSYFDNDTIKNLSKAQQISEYIKLNGPLSNPEEVKSMSFLEESDFNRLSFDFKL